MFKGKVYWLLFLLSSAVFVINIVGCSEEPQGATENQLVASCEGCHTDYAHLQEVYSPDTTTTSAGCGGDAPHYEPYDRVYMGEEGYDTFKSSKHYDVGCVGCHNGTDSTADKTLAHSGDFIAHPSEHYDDKCASCHYSISRDFETSLHHGTGQKRKVAIRSGLSGPDEFEHLTSPHKEGYSKNCATCHGTCGNCHVVRPPAGGGGLVDGHSFIKNPDMVNTCVTCHVSRGGHAYLGVASGTKADVHLTKANFECVDCHSGEELHGNGEEVHQRYAYSELPECQNCHENVETSNEYHAQHQGDFNCQVCHSQDYNNCASCHVHGEGARIPSYMDFKIAENPIPDVKPGFKFVLVRRTPGAPDNWKEYGVEEYADFDALPTYNYTSPHNILKWTSRTEVAEGNTCYSNCHIRNEGGVLVNKELYLFNEDLLDYEKDASAGITVDGKLPANWIN